MTPPLEAAAWPARRLGEAMEAVGRHCGWRTHAVSADPTLLAPADLRSVDLGRWIQSTAGCVGVEAEQVQASHGALGGLLRQSAPALVRLPGADPGRFLAVVGGGRRSLRVVTPAGVARRVRLADVLTAVGDPRDAAANADVDRLLAELSISARSRRRTRDVLVADRLAESRMDGFWMLRPGPDAGVIAHLGGTRFAGRTARLLAAHATQHALFIGSWWLIGWMALADRFAPGWLALWGLLFALLLALRLYAFTAGGHLSIDLSSMLKQQLLRGAFKLHPDQVRRQGAGQLLGRTLEVETIESFTFLGALLLATATIELVFAGVILAVGAAGVGHALLLVLWTGLLAGAAAVYLRRRDAWTDARLELTNRLVGQMVGHRTRAMQEPEHLRNRQEDADLVGYHDLANRQDRWEVLIDTLIPRGWFLVGMAALVPAFVAGGHSAAGIAAGIGGVLLGQRAFRGFASGIEQLVGAAVAWRRIQPLWAARHRPEPAGLPALAVRRPPTSDPQAFPGVRPLLDARHLRFHHPDRAAPALVCADLDVFTGDRIVLEGPSGGGKSTLARLLAAFEPPTAGVLLLEGIDPATLGIHEWRRRVVYVPQFHDNHVLMGSFAYNLLLGRAWPPSPAGLRDAEAVCRALGLGPLLDRMPGGLFQMLGETGWQLSHGERSRLFLARAILQEPEIMILDESFAALDSATLQSVQQTLLASDASILLIAHP